MDEMKIKLRTKFMRNIVSKLVAKSIYKKYGCKINIQLNELEINSIDGETYILVGAEGKVESDEFKKLLKTVVSED